MKRSLGFVTFIAAVASALCGCGSSTSGMSYAMGQPTMPPIRGSVIAAPGSVAFSIAQFIASPVPVELETNLRFNSSWTVSVDDPTQTGASEPVLTSASTATFYTYPIALGSGKTAIHVSDANIGSVSISVTQALCGRPDDLQANSHLILPRSAAANVPRGIGTLYFAVYSIGTAPSGNLHLIVGQHGTLEGGALVASPLPPGAQGSKSVPGYTLTYMKAAVPTLPAHSRIRTQIYDDTCQPSLLTGGFST
jgi:hypothetical protein